MKTLKKTLASLLALAMLLTTLASGAVFAAGTSFTDTQGHWAEKYIQTWSANSVLNGYEDGTFRPDASISRAEFSKVIVSAMNATKLASTDFSDVDANEWYSKYISRAVAAGYVQGYSDGTFQPGNPITREESFVVLARAYEMDKDTDLTFPDASQVSSWAVNAVKSLTYAGALSGDTKTGTLRPKDSITRAEVVKLLDVLSNYSESSSSSLMLTPNRNGNSGVLGGGSTGTVTKYTVTFYDGATKLGTRQVTKNSTIGSYKDPEKEGYTFKGWKDADGNTWDLKTDKVTDNLRLNAQFEINTYKVTTSVLPGSLNAQVTYSYADKDGQEITALDKVAYDTTLYLTVAINDTAADAPGTDDETPADPAKYNIGEVSVNGAKVTADKDGKYAVIVKKETSVVISVTGTDGQSYQVTSTFTPAGVGASTVYTKNDPEEDGAEATYTTVDEASNTVPYNTTIYVRSANADSNYELDSVTANGAEVTAAVPVNASQLSDKPEGLGEEINLYPVTITVDTEIVLTYKAKANAMFDLTTTVNASTAGTEVVYYTDAACKTPAVINDNKVQNGTILYLKAEANNVLDTVTVNDTAAAPDENGIYKLTIEKDTMVAITLHKVYAVTTTVEKPEGVTGETVTYSYYTEKSETATALTADALKAVSADTTLYLKVTAEEGYTASVKIGEEAAAAADGYYEVAVTNADVAVTITTEADPATTTD